jgi:hypothetical protein
MSSTSALYNELSNPLDRVERLAEKRAWPIDRTSEDEVVMSVAGAWCGLDLSLSWREQLETLEIVCAFDLKITEARRTEILNLLSQINTGLVHGHFDLWFKDGRVVFRDSLWLAGGAEANDAQCDALIRAGLDSCQHYYPAFQFVAWGNQTAEEALQSAMLETQGEA